MTTKRRSSRWSGAVACIATASLLAACTPEDPVPTTAPPTQTTRPTPSATPSVDPAVAEAEAAILQAYQGYWAAKVASFANPAQPQDPNLAHFAIDTALAEAQSTLFSMHSNGIAFVGAPQLSPVVSNIELGEESTAEINDCVDVTDWQPVYTATGDSAAAPDQALRVPTESTAHFYDGRWTIRTSVVHRDATC
jgi:hypothetical protein